MTKEKTKLAKAKILRNFIEQKKQELENSFKKFKTDIVELLDKFLSISVEQNTFKLFEEDLSSLLSKYPLRYIQNLKPFEKKLFKLCNI